MKQQTLVPAFSGVCGHAQCESGATAKEIAATLKISVRTAEAHKDRILEVLNLNSTAELVQFAIRNGLISID